MTVEALKTLLRTSITPNDPSYNAIVCEIYRCTPDSDGEIAGFITICSMCHGSGMGLGGCTACKGTGIPDAETSRSLDHVQTAYGTSLERLASR